MELLSRKIVSNSLWMMLEKFMGIFGIIFVTSYVAKYIGPTNFGKIALATTCFTFVQTLTWFGNQEILFKRVSKNCQSGLLYLTNTQKIRRLLFIFLSSPILLGFYIYSDTLTFIFGIATALSGYFLTQDIYTIYNNATLNSYINAIVNVIGLGIALLIRYGIVVGQLDYAYLAIPIILVTLIPYILKKFIINRKLRTQVIAEKYYRKYYFLAGSSLVISSLAVSFYTQISSLMLAAVTSTHELGIYAAAVTIGSAWSFINFSIITSIMSRIYKEKENYTSYLMISKLNLIIIVISLLVIIILMLLGKWLIGFLYGTEYEEAYPLLIILALSTMFSGLGTVAARFMIKQESYTYISKKMLWVAISALPISYLMIHIFGLKGAAYSVFTIELLSLTLFNYFYRNGLIFKIHFLPFFKKFLKTEN